MRSFPMQKSSKKEVPPSGKITALVFARGFQRRSIEIEPGKRDHFEFRQKFAQRFFDVAIQTGLVDEAVAAARLGVAQSLPQSRWDWVFPVLVARASGARWYQPLGEDLESHLLNLTRSAPPTS